MLTASTREDTAITSRFAQRDAPFGVRFCDSDISTNVSGIVGSRSHEAQTSVGPASDISPWSERTRRGRNLS
jgi:hypothetical protein